MDRSQYVTATTRGDFEERSFRTSDFNHRRNSGQRLPLSPYHWERFDAANDLGLFGDSRALIGLMKGSGVYRNRLGDEGPYVGNNDHFHTVISNKLVSKLRSGSVNLGVALGEYRETAEFVVSAMNRVGSIYRGIKDLRRFRFEDALHDLGRAVSHGHTRAASAWLEWTYAVKPIISDTVGVVKALTANQQPYVPVKVIRVSQRFPYNFRVGFNREGNVDFLHLIVNGSIRATAGISFFVENPFLFTLDQLGVLNPVQIGWELLPLSFVADWFLDVGQLLGNVVPPQGITFQDGFTYVKGRADCTSLQQFYYDPSHIEHYSGSSTETWKDRIILSDFPSYQLVRPNLDLSKNHLTSAAALLIQRLFGK